MSAARLIFMFVLAAQPLAAKPLVTSSEETLARICLAREETPARVVEACDGALGQAALTDTQRVELTVARADGLLWQDRFGEAASGYRRATELGQNSVEAWNGLAWAVWESEGIGAALEAFETSLAIEASVQGLGGRAAAARRIGLIGNDEAREALRAALAIEPDYSWAVREIAWSYIEDGDYPSAAAEFEAALEIDAADTNARHGLGRALLGKGEAEAALGLFNEVLAEAPNDFPTGVYRIMALRNLDRNAQALREADRLIADYPDNASGYIEKGLSLMALERRADAIETFREADEALGPDNAVLYWYADALSTDGRYEEALATIERGLALEGADFSDHLLMSYIALELGDYSLARVAAEASLELRDENPWAQYYIAVTLVHDGATVEGLGHFDLAMEFGLPDDRVGAFALELVSAGKYVEAVQLRIRY